MSEPATKPNPCPVCGEDPQVMPGRSMGEPEFDYFRVQCLHNPNPLLSCLVGPERLSEAEAVRDWNALGKRRRGELLGDELELFRQLGYGLDSSSASHREDATVSRYSEGAASAFKLASRRLASVVEHIASLEPHPLDDLISSLRFQWDALSDAGKLDIACLEQRAQLLWETARLAEFLRVAYPEMESGS